MEKVELEFKDDALREVAKRSMARKSGARGLRSILEHVLLNIMFELPSLPNLKKVIIDADVIQGKSEPLLIYGSEGDEEDKENSSQEEPVTVNSTHEPALKNAQKTASK